MAPRRYTMGKRRAAVEETRRRILEATLALHSEKGIFGTSWQDIANRADVSVGTVYKHFPSLDELVPACGELMYAITRPPSLEDAPDIFDGASSLEERLGRLVSELYGFYERGARYIETDFQERRLPSVQEWEAYMRETVAGLVREALIPTGSDERTVETVSALLDFSTFKSFLERDIQREQAEQIMNEMLLCWIGRTGRDR
ncbi:MAG TPA: TetR/AcrR family transcriptional regulator [Rubrobacteraceae bacterium]|nr:TetR/AcrR family transcriptional regulator [Rubrobacteraceae bacterium]